jgi:hypothetical protein
VIERSSESARIILVSSDSFLSDEVLELASSIDRTQYLAPVSFAQNLIDCEERQTIGQEPARDRHDASGGTGKNELPVKAMIPSAQGACRLSARLRVQR